MAIPTCASPLPPSSLLSAPSVKDNGGFFQISGSMREPATGAADFLHPGVQLPEPPAGWPGEWDGAEGPQGVQGRTGGQDW